MIYIYVHILYTIIISIPMPLERFFFDIKVLSGCKCILLVSGRPDEGKLLGGFDERRFGWPSMDWRQRLQLQSSLTKTDSWQPNSFLHEQVFRCFVWPTTNTRCCFHLPRGFWPFARLVECAIVKSCLVQTWNFCVLECEERNTSEKKNLYFLTWVTKI